MTNLEAYFNDINAASNDGECLGCMIAQLRTYNAFIPFDCDGACKLCHKKSIKWLLSEYRAAKELKNGDRLKYGQLIEVSRDGEYWYRRYFLSYVDGIFWCFYSKTSTEAVAWKHARLPKKDGDAE